MGKNLSKYEQDISVCKVCFDTIYGEVLCETCSFDNGSSIIEPDTKRLLSCFQ